MKANSSYRIWILLLLIPVTLSACQSMMVSDAQNEQKANFVLTDHTLVDRIWDVRNERFVEKEQLLSSIQATDYLFLGETHDNIIHHQNQAWIVNKLDTHGRKAGVAFEMIDSHQGELITPNKFTSSDELIEILNQVETGWMYERNYKIVFDRILERGFEIYAANLERKSLMNIVMGGNENIPNDINTALENTPLSDKQIQSIQQDIITSHCDLLDSKTAKSMVKGQRIRDAAMSVSLFKINADLKLMITGSGHARKDLGVPIYLDALDKNARILSIGMLEVSKDKDKATDYKDIWDGDSLPFDYVWFTARTEREDPCIKLKEHFLSKQKKQ